MFRRLTNFLLLAVLLSSCVRPASVDWGGDSTPFYDAFSMQTETSVPALSNGSPLQVLTATPSPFFSPTEIPSTESTPLPLPTAMSQQVQTSGAAASDFRYVVQPGTPVGISNFLHPEAGCNWFGIGGQAFNLNAEPVTGLIVLVGGSLEGKRLDRISVAGSSPGLGPGGFEVALGDHPVNSQGTVWIQLFDVNGNSQSNQVFIDTIADCERNLILINFTEVFDFRTAHFLPFVGKQRLFYWFPIVGVGPR